MSQAVETQQKELAGKYHPYPKYKDSGVEWLGDIPNEWLTIPVGRLFSRIKRTGHSEKELLSVYRDYGVIPKSSRDDNNNKESDDLAPYQLVRPNDLVMNKMKAWQGSIAVSEYEGIVSPAYFVYEPSNKLFELAHPRYVHYLLRNPIYITQYMSRSKGIRVNQWDLDPDEFKLIELLLPSKQEQSKIFEFLDYETSQIDRLIAQQQRLIELLKEKRQAVISHAVTKGLNPDAPMKDSGVEWLGQVPEHWSVVSLKYLVEEKVAGPYGASLTKAMYTTSGYRVYGQQQVINDNFHFGDYFISEEKYAEMKRYQVFPGDVLVSVMGTIGKVAVVPNDVAAGIINPRLVRYKFSKIIKPHFVQMLMMSVNYQNHLREASQGSTMEGLNMGILGDLPVAYPCFNEQNSIFEFVSEKNKRYSSIIDRAEQLVALAQERRTALISAAVTGKIDLRGWEPPAEEVAA